MRWLTSDNRKRHQRAVNKVFRRLNKHIENDDLWLGRFAVKQDEAYWIPYEDGSGHYLVIKYHFIDKKTGFTKSYCECSNHLIIWNGSHLFWDMNNFIVQDVDVWRKEDPCHDEKVDYRVVTEK